MALLSPLSISHLRHLVSFAPSSGSRAAALSAHNYPSHIKGAHPSHYIPTACVFHLKSANNAACSFLSFYQDPQRSKPRSYICIRRTDGTHSCLLILHILFLLTFGTGQSLLHRRQSPTSVSARLSVLMPRGPGDASWTTVPGRPNSHRLSDETFRMSQAMSDPKWSYGAAPDGKRSLIAFYPERVQLASRMRKRSPLGTPCSSPVDGGDNDGVATSCSGGRRSDQCFSARLMWRSGGDGEFYTYLPPGAAANKKQCSFKNSDCNPTYGASIGRGSFKRFRLNDVGKPNGRLLLQANGKSVIDIDGLVLRTSERGRFRGMQFQTFFGVQRTREFYFSDITLAITESF
ncbi:hypothetical protein FA13DRAFT_1746386 [Coprinellus micaceus]|uniref:Polysaccharide lyase 14 domain-containing protein n=1 Tax=Coprinellus micaceus TaxID=71717 RepID=A0A4Y7SBL9_COPMI|nr:hypothetical protein FA13DRAFT_1746386 [Coprinellus micaceus]